MKSERGSLMNKKTSLKGTLEGRIKMALPSKKTHKIILATYAREVLYAVPNDWEVEDIKIRDGILYLEEEAQDVPKFELDPERVPEKIEHADWEPYDEIDVWFDCEDEEEGISG